MAGHRVHGSRQQDQPHKSFLARLVAMVRPGRRCLEEQRPLDPAAVRSLMLCYYDTDPDADDEWRERRISVFAETFGGGPLPRPLSPRRTHITEKEAHYILWRDQFQVGCTTIARELNRHPSSIVAFLHRVRERPRAAIARYRPYRTWRGRYVCLFCGRALWRRWDMEVDVTAHLWHEDACGLRDKLLEVNRRRRQAKRDQFVAFLMASVKEKLEASVRVRQPGLR